MFETTNEAAMLATKITTSDFSNGKKSKNLQIFRTLNMKDKSTITKILKQLKTIVMKTGFLYLETRKDPKLENPTTFVIRRNIVEKKISVDLFDRIVMRLVGVGSCKKTHEIT